MSTSKSADHQIDRSDPDYNEFAQFQQFKALLKLTGPLAPPAQPQQQPTLRSSHSLIPAHLGNPAFVYQDETNGYLSKQFPTIGNPAPLGLCAFALTTFVLSMYNVGATVATSGPQGVVMGLAMFYGGLIQLLAGMWEMRVGNTFGATAFASYGGFWMSFAALNIQSWGFLGGYGATTVEYLNNALGIYLFAWAIFSLFMAIASHRTTVVLFSLFWTLVVTFLLLSIGHWATSVNCIQAGGAFGLLAAAIAWYAALAGILTKSNSSFTLPVWDLSKPAASQSSAPSAAVQEVELNKIV